MSVNKATDSSPWLEEAGVNLTINLENLGIGRGDRMPPTTFKPSPLFLPMPVQPVPLQTGEEVEYMLALKQELRAATKTLPFYIRRAAPKRGRVNGNIRTISSTTKREAKLFCHFGPIAIML